MSEWRLFGDINVLDEGGIFARKEYDSNEYDFQKTTYQVIQIIPHPDDENKCLAGIASIDVSDYRKNEGLMESHKTYFGKEELTDEELAFCVMDYYNMAELSSLSFNGKRAEYSCSIMEYDVNKWELAKSLKEDYGIENDNINEWADKKVGKMVDFRCWDDSLEYAKCSSLLLDNHEGIADLKVDLGHRQEEMSLEAVGEKCVVFEGRKYTEATEYPKDLIDMIMENGDEWYEAASPFHQTLKGYNENEERQNNIEEDVSESDNFYNSCTNWIECTYTKDGEEHDSDVWDIDSNDNAETIFDAMVDFAKETYGLDIIENETEWKEKVALLGRNSKDKGER